jgi:hypothetical protein
MAHSYAIITLAGLLTGSAPPGSSDLSQVDRTIAREPTYRAQPRYCLMVFGPKADVLVWMVKDGDTIYVDRNANADLTEPGESVTPIERREFMTVEDGKPSPYRELKYNIGDLAPTGRNTKHTRLELTQFQTGDKPAEFVLSLFVNDTTKQYAGWTALFRESRELAAIVHFGGPMIAQPIRYKSISLKAANPELHMRFATPGLERTTFASLAYEAVPEDIHPRAEIEWPRADQKLAPIRTTVILSGRC